MINELKASIYAPSNSWQENGALLHHNMLRNSKQVFYIFGIFNLYQKKNKIYVFFNTVGITHVAVLLVH